MGFFSDIRDRIFKRHHEATTSPAHPNSNRAEPQTKPETTTTAQAPSQTSQRPPLENQPVPAPTAPTTPSQSAAPKQDVDVAAILDEAVRDAGQPLNWRTSIVDLLKALNLDSSLASRKELAAELGFTGDSSDTATMNMWLHKQVLRKLSENGGKVPSELLD